VRDYLTARHRADPAALAWHLNRSIELDRVVDAAKLDDVVVDTTTVTIRETAEAVLSAAGW
jgi:hypothetical protein